MPKLSYLPSQFDDAYCNFGLEYALLKKIRLPFPVLLLWQTPETVMLGRYQSIPAEVNLPFIKKQKINLVRRKSGGGTIFTDRGTLQFSIIQPADDTAIEFKDFIEPVVKAVNRLGPPARFNGRNDLVLDGKKFSGNAQYRQDAYVVHHGSLLFNCDLKKLESAIKPDIAKLKSKGISSIRDRVVNLSDFLPEMTCSEFRYYLADALTEGAPLKLTSKWRELALNFAAEEFKAPEKIWGLNPAFERTRSLRFKNGRVSLKYSVEKGLIKAAAIEGDFFANLEPGELQTMLKGVEFNESAVKKALEKGEFSKKVYKIKSEDLLKLFFE